MFSEDLLKQNYIVDWGYTTQDVPISLNAYHEWIDKELHGNLSYLADERKDKRSNLKNFYPEFQSAFVFLFDYTSAAKRNIERKQDRVAAYVSGFDGIDYHYWIKDRLDKISEELKLSDKIYTIDAQPVLERDLAYRAGLGWFGKNSMLISQEYGSFFIIAGILTNRTFELTQKSQVTDHCGNCSRCIDACPTNAIIDNKVIDASRCISSFTIEEFRPVARPLEFAKDRAEIFGCDICQNVCPWNKKPLSRTTALERDNFFTGDLATIKSDLENMSNREYKRRFKGTALERTGRVGILKNIIL